MQKLPGEVVELILLENVLSEVQDLHLTRDARMEEAEVVITRLTNVCLQWRRILSSELIWRRIHKILLSCKTKNFPTAHCKHRVSYECFYHRPRHYPSHFFVFFKVPVVFFRPMQRWCHSGHMAGVTSIWMTPCNEICSNELTGSTRTELDKYKWAI